MLASAVRRITAGFVPLRKWDEPWKNAKYENGMGMGRIWTTINHRPTPRATPGARCKLMANWVAGG